jgi:putative transposase
MEYKRKLPHFDHEGASFFVTFRLDNSIPAPIARELRKKRADDIAALKNSDVQDKQQRLFDIERAYFMRFEDLLDHPTYGDRYLEEPQCAEIVKEVLHEYDGKFYTLDTYCIMPNHVHVLLDTAIQLNEDGFAPNNYQYLKDIMRRIKSKTAVFLNRSRQTQGQVWEEESYDRYIRNVRHREYVENYIVQNPIKAHLGTIDAPYPYVYVRQTVAVATELAP